MTFEQYRPSSRSFRAWEPVFCGFLVVIAVLVCFQANARSPRIPWDLDRLSRVPQAEWGAWEDGVCEVFYEGEPLKGRATRVFAYCAKPEGEGPFPAMVLVHGGGGTAFREWTELWADRGYVALAMDLAGCGPERKRLPDGGPDQTHAEKFAPFDENSYDQMWTYHAVAAAMLGHSLLESLPEVDASRTGVTGISWGGYLTCILAGVDPRFEAAVPVYGCGYLDEHSTWTPIFEQMSEEQCRRWVRYFDPSQYLSEVECPIFFLNGTDDFAYPLDVFQKSVDTVPGEALQRIEVHMKHSHQHGWAPKEIGLFIDSVLDHGTPLAKVGEFTFAEDRFELPVEASVSLKRARLHWTMDPKAYQSRRENVRRWQSEELEIEGDRCIRGKIPDGRPIVFFVTVTDERDAMVSSRAIERGDDSL